MRNRILLLFLSLAVLLAITGEWAGADPEWEPGTPQPYSWTNIILTLWWPYSYTPRAHDWGCYAKAYNHEDRTWHRLEFHDSSTPFLDHRFMIAVFNFTYLQQPTSQWTLNEGACFITNRNGTIMYSVPIDFLQ